MEGEASRFAGEVVRLEMLDQIGVDLAAQGEGLVQRFVEHRVGDVARAQVGEPFQFGLVVFRQPRRLPGEINIHQRVGGVKIQFEIRKYPDDIGFEVGDNYNRPGRV